MKLKTSKQNESRRPENTQGCFGDTVHGGSRGGGRAGSRAGVRVGAVESPGEDGGWRTAARVPGAAGPGT